MLTGGMMVKEVAKHFHVSESTVSRLNIKYHQTGTIKDRPRPGRPHKTTQLEDNFIVTSSRRNHFLIPLFHTGPESHELPRIDKYLDSCLKRTQFVKILTVSHSS